MKSTLITHPLTPSGEGEAFLSPLLSRRCWSSEKSELHYETLMNNRADFSVSNNNQKLQIASPSPRQARCNLRLRETLGQGSESPPELADQINFVQCGRLKAKKEVNVNHPPPNPLRGGGSISIPAESNLHRTQRENWTNIKALSPRQN